MRTLSVAAMAAVFIIAGAPERLSAQVADVVHTTADSVGAFFVANEPIVCSDGSSGTVQTSAFVNIFVTKEQRPPGAPTSQSNNLIQMGQSDSCPGSQFVFMYGNAPDLVFTTNQALSSATLKGSATLTLIGSPDTVDVDVDLTFTATGDPTRQVTNLQNFFPGHISFSRSRGVFRDATGTGTITDGTTNFTPTPSNYAQLGTADYFTLEKFGP